MLFLKVSTYPNAREITTTFVIKIIDEGSFDIIIKTNPHQAEPAGKNRMLLFDHFSSAPVRVPEVLYDVTHPQIQFSCHERYINIVWPQQERQEPAL